MQGSRWGLSETFPQQQGLSFHEKTLLRRFFQQGFPGILDKTPVLSLASCMMVDSFDVLGSGQRPHMFALYQQHPAFISREHTHIERERESCCPRCKNRLLLLCLPERAVCTICLCTNAG